MEDYEKRLARSNWRSADSEAQKQVRVDARNEPALKAVNEAGR